MSMTPTSKHNYNGDIEQIQAPDTSSRRRPFSTQSQMPSRGVVVLHPMQAEPDDYLHIPDKNIDAHSIRPTWRGCINFSTLFIIACALLMLFIGYPLIANFTDSYNNVNDRYIHNAKSPPIPMPPLIDPATPKEAYSRQSQYDQSEWDLVFSDEFNKEGRTFWPGEDPYWEAGDFYYLATQDYEWYTPEAIRTMGGYLVITMENIVEHNANFRSGMLQSWNKFCIQGGYVEASVILPATATTQGYWPGFWMMGNLGRPGYLGTTDGMWPYSYSNCDVGILDAQQYLNGTGPHAAIDSSKSSNSAKNISTLPGMRFPSCTCSGQNHPGPNPQTARSVPELDVFEMQVKPKKGTYASQSYQIAPFDDNYRWYDNSSAYIIYDKEKTERNPYSGGPTQEALSCVSKVPDSAFFGSDQVGSVMGVEYMPDFDRKGQGYATWYVDGKKTWTLFETAMAPNEKTQIGQRTLPLEPMSLILNLGISKGFQNIDWDNIEFPAHLAFDYVRVYQKRGEPQRISCDPPDFPTSYYIHNNLDLYYNSNITRKPSSLTDPPALEKLKMHWTSHMDQNDPYGAHPVRVLYEPSLPAMQRYSSPVPLEYDSPSRRDTLPNMETADLQLEDLNPARIPQIDRDQLHQYVPSELHWLFEPINTKHQPHLDKLRERKRKLDEAWSTGDMSLSEDAPLIMQEARNKRKASAQGLLSEAEKKANHIASEQKRRSNIRKGYDMLCNMVPGLDKNALESTQKKQSASDEDANDQRGGTLSEISILEEALDHLIYRLKHHHMLLLRKYEAQQRVLSQGGRTLA
ncbi:hypothetical protein MEQU1_001567 [Malassezia equina]|uniref:BHLH domain-containing protein n=1 Tax=Malassezia equina TaxID=1381935 RepID=A0AAF0EC64_9BASI|nr:hypothetical protein MEQU1_001567 [Malassezia equina]